jgi:hypothetical protein
MLSISVRVSADDSAGVLCTQTYLGLPGMKSYYHV